MKLKDIVIILCRPSEPGNMGAVCRVMKNMGLSSLRLVSATNVDDAIIRARAVHAQDIWEEASFYENLNDAIADCAVVIGTSRRRGKKRKDITLTAREAALFLKKYPAGGGEGAASGNTGDGENIRQDGPPVSAAIVFGNERTGLESDELALCDFASHIPSNEAFPSLNLSHSAQIYCYELAVAFSEESPQLTRGTWMPVGREKIDKLCDSLCDSLASLGFYTHSGREGQHEFFRDIFSRAGLSESEVRYVHNIFAKAARLGQKT
ncbi:MAG: RNA methyltransferase [Spirochaetaceae bacterium]|jgi:tRNA/rRNA methyltransferase/tRNA (cytidine32/uridine32-2'-O)-methyltransferase|nr:RNA methyltransferase [Spirochaetaceae bacterium]